MRKKGSIVQVNAQRDNELMAAYKEAVSAAKSIRLDEVFRRAVETPCSRFWCSEERAYMVCLKIKSGVSIEQMNPTRREMFMEIFRRVEELRAFSIGESFYTLVIRVVNSPAPKFYLTPKSAQVIVHHIKKKCLEEKKKRLRFLL